MRRRDFIAGLGGAAVVVPRGAWGQQAAVPVIGFLRASTAAGSEHLTTAFRQGLKEAGYVEGQNVAIEYRWTDGYPERLAALANDLVRRPVTVILASASNTAIAVKGATSTIPIVFVVTSDPVKAGLVGSFNRPGGNATGLAYLSSALGGKRLEFLQQLVPTAKSVAVIVHPHNVATDPFLRDLQAAASALGLQLVVTSITSANDIEGAFASLAERRPAALILGADPIFTSQIAPIIALAARYALPAIGT